VLEVVELICATAGTGVRPSLRGNGGGIDQAAVDIGELGATAGWTPAVGIDDGIARTVDWYRRYPEALDGLTTTSR
jgi:nucleoside-diphosphate-sugar epimerase